MKFEYVEVKSVVVEELQKVFPPTIRVMKSDPRDGAELPAIGVNRISDDEAEQVLGDDIGGYMGEDGLYKSLRGTFFSESIEVRIWHKNADERDKLYAQTKATLFRLRTRFSELGIRNIRLSGGRDEQDTTLSQVPFPVYWAVINMHFLNPLEVEEVYDKVESVNVIASYRTFKTEIGGNKP